METRVQGESDGRAAVWGGGWGAEFFVPVRLVSYLYSLSSTPHHTPSHLLSLPLFPFSAFISNLALVKCKWQQQGLQRPPLGLCPAAGVTRVLPHDSTQIYHAFLFPHQSTGKARQESRVERTQCQKDLGLHSSKNLKSGSITQKLHDLVRSI